MYEKNRFWAKKKAFLARKSALFLRYSHITPTFWAQTDPTQWDHKSPISWGNSGYLRFSGRLYQYWFDRLLKPDILSTDGNGLARGERCSLPKLHRLQFVFVFVFVFSRGAPPQSCNGCNRGSTVDRPSGKWLISQWKSSVWMINQHFDCRQSKTNVWMKIALNLKTFL